MPPPDCLNDGGGDITLTGELSSQFHRSDLDSNIVIDARQATWDGLNEDGEPIQWVVTLDGEPGGCWHGGAWTGAWDDTDPDITWSDPYHHAGFITLRLPNFTVEAARATNQGDGIRMEERAADFKIRGVYLSDIHDDCIENDFMHAGLLTDSLLDGCYVALSAARYEGNDADGSDRTWTVVSNLIRMEPQPTPYRGPAPGTGPIFKWTDGSPQVVLRDNIFRVDQPPNHGYMGIPEELDLIECEGNVVVWTGEGDYPAPLPDCFEITTDLAVWEDAVSAWRGRHSK